MKNTLQWWKENKSLRGIIPKWLQRNSVLLPSFRTFCQFLWTFTCFLSTRPLLKDGPRLGSTTFSVTPVSGPSVRLPEEGVDVGCSIRSEFWRFLYTKIVLTPDLILRSPPIVFDLILFRSLFTDGGLDVLTGSIRLPTRWILPMTRSIFCLPCRPYIVPRNIPTQTFYW